MPPVCAKLEPYIPAKPLLNNFFYFISFRMATCHHALQKCQNCQRCTFTSKAVLIWSCVNNDRRLLYAPIKFIDWLLDHDCQLNELAEILHIRYKSES